MKQILSILVILCLLISCKETDNSIDSPVLSFTLNENGGKDFYTVTPDGFTNQDGIMLNSSSTLGKVHTANFFFTSCPTICPKMREVHIDLANEFDSHEDFMQLSFTIDLKRDTVKKLRDYAALTNIPTEQWNLLRGDDILLQEIALELKSNFSPNEDGTDFYHSSYVALLDKKQRIRGFYNLLSEKEVILLKEDISKLLKE